MPKARFENIYRDLKVKILDGTYAYQTFLPTETELTASYACSRNTLRRALSMLSDETYLQPIHGKGVRVIWQKQSHEILGSLEGLESFHEYAERNGLIPFTEVKQFDAITCTAALAERTGFLVGDQLIRIVRVRGLNGVARQVDHDYLLSSAVQGLTEKDAARSIFSYLENTLGMRILTSKRQITVELASDEDSSYLDLGPYNSVAVTESNSFNSEGIMFEFTQSRSHPMTFCYNVISKREAKQV
ncbi:GntR family transcriptional regulator [Atopobium sp. oral taxon 199]|uniref:GntR family transcriptional regulator n=1 Tax=Atopobium sp. oral taxon 199 TaxID=712156 RepID=UPI00034E7E53|nr:UTRA domain-containing protein [Atopobium sp. oral taxon 199]EPD77519.1 GntR family transcriptional regulator, trehalose operon transcriptional repressor [Atopobium sp. oral taxon 199 str. F0494]